MSRVRGPVGNLRNLNKALRALPRRAAIEIARVAAPEITGLMRASFDAGQTVFGDARPLGSHGNVLSLVKTGDARRSLLFTSDGGTKIRASLPMKYAKYLIGKYRIMPNGNQAMPLRWRSAIADITRRVLGLLMPAANEVGATAKRAA